MKKAVFQTQEKEVVCCKNIIDYILGITDEKDPYPKPKKRK